jgi:hypothetical protein
MMTSPGWHGSEKYYFQKPSPVRQEPLANMRGLGRKQQGWLLPFCLIHLALCTTLMMVELDRSILFLRQTYRVIQREQVLQEVSRGLSQWQSSSPVGSLADTEPVSHDQSEVNWLSKPSPYTIMLPGLQVEQGYCQWQVQLLAQFSLGGLSVSLQPERMDDENVEAVKVRDDRWFVYLCEWFESGREIMFFVPQTYW